MDVIKCDIFLKISINNPRTVRAINNQCLRRGTFPRRWKRAKIIPIAKPGKENSMDPLKYRPISLPTIGGQVLEQIHINSIKHHM